MDWDKHKFGPGYDVCARCRGAKAPARRKSKWCSTCDDLMRSRRGVTGGLDAPDTTKGVTRRSRIIRG